MQVKHLFCVSFQKIAMRTLLSSILLFVLLGRALSQEASISEELVSLPTYPFSDPDPVARPGKIYPYFKFDGYSTVPVVQKHKMVVMENNWIKVWIAPDMGGKIYGALDKKIGKYFIYFNNVVKFREIAMRGPWTSGGIEFNFGSIGHAPTTATPVDYSYRKNPDGSVSCFVGALELTSRTEWRVEIRLPNDKAWFETRSSWQNPTNQKTSLYHWQTAAADATDDLQYFFPGTAYIDHSGNAFAWPLMSDGRDISFYRNNNYGTAHSYHVLGEYTDWFAGYYHNSGTGFGHWSRYPYKPGKKIWIWGLSRQGEIWKGLLTDSARGNVQYTEIQTGLLFNQEADESTMSPFKHLYLMPGAVEQFNERWFPIGNTKGVVSVSKEGVLNIDKEKTGSSLIFQSLENLKDTLQITDTTGKLLGEYSLEMKPQDIFIRHIDFDPGNLIITLKNGELFYKTAKRNNNQLDRPLEHAPKFNWESAYGLYSKGVEKSKQRLYSEAQVYFEKCIAKDPDFMPAYTGLAEIDFREMRYDEVEKRLLHVLSFDTYDPDANYLYGNILVLRKEFNKAKDAMGVALRSPAYKSAALNQLAVIAVREKRFEEAWEYISTAVAVNGIDVNNLKTAAIIARLRGDKSNYSNILLKISSADPLCHMAAFEKYLTSNDSISLKDFTDGINTELKHEVFIELSLWYFNAGLEDEAYSVMKLSPQHPVADLLTAYLAFRRGDEKNVDFNFKRAINTDDKLVFPYRHEYREILTWANMRQSSWKTKYYFALFNWGTGRNDLARKYFNECGDSPDSYSFYLSRGSFEKQNGGNEEADYLKALKWGSDNWRPCHILHGYYMTVHDYGKALSVSLNAMKLFRDSYIIKFDHALSLLNSGRYEECIRLLSTTEILPYEGAGYGRVIWRQANLLEALRLIDDRKISSALTKISSARLWPENLGVGRPYAVDESPENLLEAYCLIKNNNKELANKLIVSVSDNLKDGITADHATLTGVIALKAMNRKGEADKALTEWSVKVSDNVVSNWAMKNLAGNLDEKTSGQITTDPEMEKAINALLQNNVDYIIIRKINQLFEDLK
jgi:tetratricopeptide (TPR) repeat protein